MLQFAKELHGSKKNDSSETSSFLEPGAALDCEIRFN